MFARGYTLLNYITLQYPKIKCFLVFNKMNEDKMDYSKMCKKSKIEFIILDEDKKIFLRKIKSNY